MPGGRPRKPTHLKIVSGTAQKCRMNPDEPKPSSELPTPPDWLSERASAIFRELVVIIDRMRIASASDISMLALLASRLEEVEICTAIIEDGGRFFTSKIERDEAGNIVSQQIRPHPAVGQRSNAMRHAQSLLAEFGISPAARSKVSASKKPADKNPFGALG